MTQINSQCMVCAHFNAAITTTNVCSAFPEGIPTTILLNKTDHRRPVAGDHGIQWTLDPTVPASLAHHPLEPGTFGDEE